MSHVYDFIYAPSRQPQKQNTNGVRISRGHRVLNARPDITTTNYSACKLTLPSAGNKGYDTEEECKTAAGVCLGPGLAYGYVCGQNSVELQFTNQGKLSKDVTNCYGCSKPNATGDGTPQAFVFSDDKGQIDGTCIYRMNGHTDPNSFNTAELCTADPQTKCGWKFNCV